MHLIENRKQCIVRLQDGDSKLDKFFELIPGPNQVPGRIWEQAKLVEVVQHLLEDGDLRDHGGGSLAELGLSEALEIANRPMSVPMARDWLATEQRKKVRSVLESAIEASE